MRTIRAYVYNYKRPLICVALLVPILFTIWVFKHETQNTLSKVVVAIPPSTSFTFSKYVPDNYQLIQSSIVITNTKKPENTEGWPSIDIVFPIVAKDAGLLVWLLNSIELLFPHYNQVILLVERRDLYMVRGSIPIGQGRYRIVVVNNPFEEAERAQNRNFGYIIQQWYKFYSDKFSTADFIMILESDLVIAEKPTVEKWFKKENGKLVPIHPTSDYELDRKKQCSNPTTCNLFMWKAGAEYAYNGRDRLPTDTEHTYVDAKYEYMQHQPFIYPTAFFKDLRDHITTTHKKTMEQFFDHYANGIHFRYDGRSDKMSEFNIFGHYAYSSPKWKNEFYFMTNKAELDAYYASGVPIQHISIFRNGALPNPKLTLEYITAALMYIHNGKCRTNPEDEICKVLPANQLPFPAPYNIY